MSGKKIIEGMTEALATAKGEMPVGTKVYTTFKTPMTIGNFSVPAGKYVIERLPDDLGGCDFLSK